MSDALGSGRRSLAADAVVTPDGVLSPGWVTVAQGSVESVGVGHAPDGAEQITGTLLPGFVDGHVHGAVGHDFGTATAAGVRAAAAHLWATGSTTVVASLATAAIETLVAQIGVLAPLVDDCTLQGIHLEGPHLSPVRAGAHALELLRSPSADDVERVLDAAGGRIAMVTLAPELPGALMTIRRLSQAGVTVALGHTDADANTIRAAIDAGATVATHLFNGMAPLDHRSPGPVGVLLTDERVTVELILDGMHLSPEAETIALRTAQGRTVAVSDAMAATGRADGRYHLAGNTVVVSDGVARTDATGSLAGSTSPLAVAAARLRRQHRATFPEIARTLSTRPADLLKRPGLGRLEAGASADMVLVSPTAQVLRVMRKGIWL